MFLARRCSATGLPKVRSHPYSALGSNRQLARSQPSRKCHIQPLHYGPVPYRSTARNRLNSRGSPALRIADRASPNYGSFPITAEKRRYRKQARPLEQKVAVSRKGCDWCTAGNHPRSEEHTSELQSLRHLVCRLLLEKKKTTQKCRTGSRSSRSDRQSPRLNYRH